jgi:hypothetical protein
MALVRERTIPTEWPPPVGEVSANFLWIEGCHVSVQRNPRAVNLCFLDRKRLVLWITYSIIYSLLTCIFLCFHLWTLDFFTYFLPLWVRYLSINGNGNLINFWFTRRCPCKVWIIFCIFIATNHTLIFDRHCTISFPARNDVDCKYFMTSYVLVM